MTNNFILALNELNNIADKYNSAWVGSKLDYRASTSQCDDPEHPSVTITYKGDNMISGSDMMEIITVAVKNRLRFYVVAYNDVPSVTLY